MKLSVIIPTLNEAANLCGLLERLSDSPGIFEVVVADGGSTDGTRDLCGTATLVLSEPGRGMQLRAGASAAIGDVLLFLHADVFPPRNLATQISSALDTGFVGGNFRLKYPEGGFLGRWLESLAPLYRRMGRYYGDSGIFVRRDVYDECGGFPHVPIMEDIIFIERMERAGHTAYLPGPMESSTRRFKGRAIRTLLLWGVMQLLFALGVSPWRLAKLYRAHKR
jgi:rSAM/selenodomain-associated transferase 2